MGLFRRKNKRNRELRQTLYSYLTAGTPLVLYDYNLSDYIEKGYSSNSDVYSIIKKITNKCNVATPYIYIDNESVKYRKINKSTVHGIAKNRLEVGKALDFAPEDNDLSKLLKNPNETTTWRELITLFRIFHFVQGEAFMFRECGDDDCAISLQIAPAHRMHPIVGKDDFGEKVVVGWKYSPYNGKSRELDVKDVFHHKMPNPNYDGNHSHLRGMSPLMAGLKYLQLDDKAIEGWIKNLENEGAKGIISPNHADPELWLTPEQVEATEKNVDEKIHGFQNKNKIVVSGMPLQYTQIGLSPDALNIINGLNQAGYKLCDLWGVPAVLFDPNPTYENQAAASKRFVLDVILPYLNEEEDKLNQWLVAPFAKRDNKKYVLDYDLSAYDELRLSVSDTDAFLKTHSINEVRVMLGSDESENEYANEIFIQQGLVPLSDYDIDRYETTELQAHRTN